MQIHRIPMIEIQNIHWNPGTSILQNIDLQILKGDMWIILGANGSGKSSLLKCICGWIKPNQGDIRIDDISVQNLSHIERASRIALLPQKTELAENISVIEWMRFGRYRFKESEKESIQIIEKLLKSHNLEHLSSKMWTELSGGEAQRISLISMMAQDSETWLLDEPANHLDPKVQHHIYRIIADEWSCGRNIILVTHNINLILQAIPLCKHANVQVLGLKNGRIQHKTHLDDQNFSMILSDIYDCHTLKIQAFNTNQYLFEKGSK